MRDDDERIEPDICGHGIGLRDAGFTCGETGDHDEHVWRGEAQASCGLGHADNRPTAIEIRWHDDRSAATVGDLRRLIASRDGGPLTVDKATRCQERESGGVQCSAYGAHDQHYVNRNGGC